MNLTNSSLINENTAVMIVIIDIELFSISSPPIMPRFSNNRDITVAYAIYPTKRATARATSLGLGF